MNRTCVDTELMPFDLARSILADAGETLSAEPTRLSDALGRVAAENIVAKEDLVPYARSAMDGYALRAADTLAASSGSPVGIPVVGKVFTGEGRSTLTANAAMGITTGAPVPINADAVIPHERVTVRNGMIFIEKAVSVGDCIFPPAEDVRCGETLLKRGSVL
jgi:molybdopterin molybdotransferase